MYVTPDYGIITYIQVGYVTPDYHIHRGYIVMEIWCNPPSNHTSLLRLPSASTPPRLRA